MMMKKSVKCPKALRRHLRCRRRRICELSAKEKAAQQQQFFQIKIHIALWFMRAQAILHEKHNM